ncbi:MAG: aspartate 1-decarboxylase [Candidatus Altiarchaeota archaeon]
MLREFLRAKIHGATVTEANVEYTGSITIDEAFLDAAGIGPYEKVLVGDLTNGARFTTYTLVGEKGSGVVCVNGAAAKLVEVGDKVIIMCFGLLGEDEVEGYKPRVIYLDGENRIQ